MIAVRAALRADRIAGGHPLRDPAVHRVGFFWGHLAAFDGALHPLLDALPARAIVGTGPLLVRVRGGNPGTPSTPHSPLTSTTPIANNATRVTGWGSRLPSHSTNARNRAKNPPPEPGDADLT